MSRQSTARLGITVGAQSRTASERAQMSSGTAAGRIGTVSTDGRRARQVSRRRRRRRRSTPPPPPQSASHHSQPVKRCAGDTTVQWRVENRAVCINTGEWPVAAAATVCRANRAGYCHSDLRDGLAMRCRADRQTDRRAERAARPSVPRPRPAAARV